MIKYWCSLSHQTREKILSAMQYSLIAIALGGLNIGVVLMMFQLWIEFVPILLIFSIISFVLTWVLHGWEDILIWYPNRWWKDD